MTIDDQPCPLAVPPTGTRTTTSTIAPLSVGLACLAAAQRAAYRLSAGVAVVVSDPGGHVLLAARHEASADVLDTALDLVRRQDGGGFAWCATLASRTVPAAVFTHAEVDVVLTLASSDTDVTDLFDDVHRDLSTARRRFLEQR